MPAPMETYDQWAHWRDTRNKRRHTIMLLSAAGATQVIALVLVGHLLLGRLRWIPQAPTVAIAVGVLLLILDVTMVIAPHWTLERLNRVFRAAGHALLGGLGIALTASVYLAAWPWARTRGRSGFVRRHPASAPWADPTAHWKRSTWASKGSAADRTATPSRSTLRRALSVFHRQRQYFLLLVLLVLLALATITMFVKSSAVAPFVYTLF